MLKEPTEFIIIFIIISVILILTLIVIITLIIYRYQQKQNAYFKEIESLKESHQNELLKSQLEIQEQTLQNISREIHDNIGQKLTLAKLHLNTLDYNDTGKTIELVNNSVNIISEAINEMSNLSHSMSSEIILNYGLIKALENELAMLKKSGIFKINLSISGNSVFMDANTELVLFRITQEALNNIIRHAGATAINIIMDYNPDLLFMTIEDNGKGFNLAEIKPGNGLLNMQKRAALLKGNLLMSSEPGMYTKIKIEIPLHENIAGL